MKTYWFAYKDDNIVNLVQTEIKAFQNTYEGSQYRGSLLKAVKAVSELI